MCSIFGFCFLHGVKFLGYFCMGLHLVFISTKQKLYNHLPHQFRGRRRWTAFFAPALLLVAL